MFWSGGSYVQRFRPPFSASSHRARGHGCRCAGRRGDGRARDHEAVGLREHRAPGATNRGYSIDGVQAGLGTRLLECE